MSAEITSEKRTGKRVIPFLIILFVLSVGIGIGTLITYQVGASGPGDSQLKIQSDGKPLVASAVLGLSQTFENVAKRVEPAVVNIATEEIVRISSRQSPQQGEGDDPFNQFWQWFGSPMMPEQYTRNSLGTGVIVDPKGYIITNNHVVESATKIRVSVKDDKEYPAKVIAGDELSDIAVIKIDGSKPFPTVDIGDAKAMKVGDWVLAIGSPFGLEQTVTAGIISAIGRTFENTDANTLQMLFNDYLQTDAAINPGNSGGPLVNMNGEVVGINSFISTTSSPSNAGVGFAVPSNIFVNVYNQIIEKGKVLRGWLGVNMNTLPFTPAMAKYFGVEQGSGVLITGLTDENGDNAETGPAAKAGIKAEDVITEFDGKKITGVQEFRMAVAGTPPGQKVKIKIVRHGTEEVFEVALGERKIEEQQRRGPISFDTQPEEPRAELGLSIDNVPTRTAQSLNISGGALILDVKAGSLAEEAGLQGQNQYVSDIIVEANGKKIDTAQDLLNLVRSLRSGEDIVVKFIRYSSSSSGTFFTSLTKP